MASTGNENRYLCFSLGKELFAVELLSVVRVIGFPDLTPMPQTPPYFLGITNLRGDVLPIIDLSKKMGIHTEIKPEKRAVLIAEVDGSLCGFTVDEVTSVLNPKAEDITEKLPATGSKADQFMRKIIKAKDKLIVQLDLNRVFSSHELPQLKVQPSPKAA